MLSLIKGSARPLACLIPRTSSVLSTRSFHHAFTPYQQQNQSQHDNQIPTGLRQKNIPTPGANEDADSAISGFMNMFNEKDSKTVTISSCTKHGFVTTEAINLQGPVLCIGGQVFLWDIFQKDGAVDRARKAASSSGTPLSTRPIFESMDEATAKEIFKIFQLMNPRPGKKTICCYDLTSGWCRSIYYKSTQVATAFPLDTTLEILIVGTGKVFGPLSPAVRSVIRGYGLQVDMMSTANAAATYNMLAEEGREVAAALLPLEPSTVQIVKGNQ